MFAVVGDTVITAAQFDAALQSTMRQKYFHRQVPEAKRQAFEREVAGQLIERSLLLAEARRRGFDAGERDPVEQLRATLQTVGEPSADELRNYYDTHVDLFVEPAQSRVSVMLLRVDAAAPRTAWEEAESEVRAARERMLESGDYGALRDLGYLHDGMLPQAITARLAAMAPGELSEPIRILEGIALVRMVEKRPARTQPFDEARERASQLRQREEAAQRWNALIESLRRAATIRIDLARYPALSGIAP